MIKRTQCQGPWWGRTAQVEECLCAPFSLWCLGRLLHLPEPSTFVAQGLAGRLLQARVSLYFRYSLNTGWRRNGSRWNGSNWYAHYCCKPVFYLVRHKSKPWQKIRISLSSALCEVVLKSLAYIISRYVGYWQDFSVILPNPISGCGACYLLNST